MNFKIVINRKTGFKLLSFFLAVSIVFRCSPTIFYQRTLIEYMIVIACTACSFMCFKMNKVYLFEICLLISPLLCFSNLTWTKYLFYLIITIFYYFCIQNNNYECFFMIKLPILLFATWTSCVTWFSFFFPSIYISKILPLFSDSDSLISYFKYQNMYMGFTNHYSRNAYYIILAIFILVSGMLAKKQKYKKTRGAFLLFFSVTELLVAKRGPLFFLVISVLIIVFLKEPNLFRGIKKFWKYIVGISILGILAILFIPGANNIVIRMISMFESGNFTTRRSYLYVIAFNMFKNSPLFGQGWDSFRLSMMSTSTFQGVHNDYLQYLTETGIVGFSIVMIANLGALFYSIKGFKLVSDNQHNGTDLQIWSIFALLYQVFILLYSLTGLPHFSYEQYALYLMSCGYSVAIYRLMSKIRVSEEGMII